MLSFQIALTTNCRPVLLNVKRGNEDRVVLLIVLIFFKKKEVVCLVFSKD